MALGASVFYLFMKLNQNIYDESASKGGDESSLILIFLS